MYDGPIFVSTWRGTERTLGQLGAVERSIGKAPQAERALDYEQGKMVCWFLHSEEKGSRCGTHENIHSGGGDALTRRRSRHLRVDGVQDPEWVLARAHLRAVR